MKIIGVDVGFSKKRATTGIAWLDGDRLCVSRVGTAQEQREAALPHGFQASTIALDGPLLPPGAKTSVRRSCELIFVHRPFHNRCKPGLSHWGMGLELRQASAEACRQFERFLSRSSDKQRAAVSRNGPLVEAFPNAFLGVLTPEGDLSGAPKLKRGKRFDWLYEKVVTTGKLESTLSQMLDLPTDVWRKLMSETHHEKRAALICLLTAALAARGLATVVGEESGGWFWLPPLPLWEPWARQGLGDVVGLMASKGLLVRVE
ncbi:DUF429 domain-containing protein [Methyloceanibacter sp.]|uniref:DUF429 domain-containing protein n=1 Tax=Methyloceanibacter sp. TaxID=1965321 RepID=UPI003D6D3EC7